MLIGGGDNAQNTLLKIVQNWGNSLSIILHLGMLKNSL